MIDLHMHTKYSDGTESVEEILRNAKNLELEIISITDHDTCDAHVELEGKDVSKIYNGKIIVGCEFTTSYKGRLIEILGYGFDYKEVSANLKSYYTEEVRVKRVEVSYNKLMDNIKRVGLVFDENELDTIDYNNEFYERSIYEELLKHEKNLGILNEDIWGSFSDFFRKGIANPDSAIFTDPSEFKLDIESVINLIHSSGGKAFLAHPYQYKFVDTEEFLGDLYSTYNIDGIECYYTTFTKEETEKVLNFAKRKNLLISGGSDYHGTRKANHNLGTGNNNLNISRDIIKDWKTDFFR